VTYASVLGKGIRHIHRALSAGRHRLASTRGQANANSQECQSVKLCVEHFECWHPVGIQRHLCWQFDLIAVVPFIGKVAPDLLPIASKSGIFGTTRPNRESQDIWE
jgi:hypothetical protein